MSKNKDLPVLLTDAQSDATVSACIREDGKIHAVVFKLVAESNVVSKTAPTLWSLVDVMLVSQEEFSDLPKYLEDLYGPGLYHLYQGKFDKIHIQDIDRLKDRAEKDIGTIEAAEQESKMREKEKISTGSHGFD